MLNPVISKLDESKKKKIASQFEEVVEDDGEGSGVDPDKEDERLNTGKLIMSYMTFCRGKKFFYSDT